MQRSCTPQHLVQLLIEKCGGVVQCAHSGNHKAKVINYHTSHHIPIAVASWLFKGISYWSAKWVSGTATSQLAYQQQSNWLHSPAALQPAETLGTWVWTSERTYENYSLLILHWGQSGSNQGHQMSRSHRRLQAYGGLLQWSVRCAECLQPRGSLSPLSSKMSPFPPRQSATGLSFNKHYVL